MKQNFKYFKCLKEFIATVKFESKIICAVRWWSKKSKLIDLIFRIVNLFAKPKNMEERVGYAYIFTIFLHSRWVLISPLNICRYPQVSISALPETNQYSKNLLWNCARFSKLVNYRLSVVSFNSIIFYENFLSVGRY